MIRNKLIFIFLFSLIAACGQPSSRVETTAPSAASGNARKHVTACDRVCLLGYVNRYVTALVGNDPGLAPFAHSARFTENAQALELGDGLWNTATGRPGDYRLVVADGTTGQAGFYLIMEESGQPVWLAGRLKVEARRISELETVVVRKGSGFGNFDLDAPAAVWNEILAPEQRRSREALIEIADKYLEALDENLADFATFDDHCKRVENGVQTANAPDANLGTADGPNVAVMSCRDNINSMMWRYITDIDPRRYLVVDEDRGIVFGVFMFHHDGSNASTEIPGFGEYSYRGAARRPFTTVIPEMFKIVDGKILQIEATMTALPFGSKSGWDK
jgi:hypothetical protein